ncbi:MAG: LysR family transcriptional regulator [Kofleriaceae bacterium]
MDWDGLRFFAVVARRRTLSAAARELGVTQPTVGRRIAALEQQLGARLFVRRADGYMLTSAGADMLERVDRVDQEIVAAERAIRGRDEGVTGAVRITASEWLVTSVLAPMIAPLVHAHPALVVELVADPRHLNLAQREADIALRPRRFEHAAIKQRAAGRLGFGLYASKRYLARHGAPRAGDGSGHTLVEMTEDIGDVARAWLEDQLPHATRAIRTNGRDAMVALAAAGAGVACLARIVGDTTPNLERVRFDRSPPSPTLWLGVHQDVHRIPRVRAVAMHLADQLRALQGALCPPG